MKYIIMPVFKRIFLLIFLVFFSEQFSYSQGGLKSFFNKFYFKESKTSNDIAVNQMLIDVKELVSSKYSGRRLGTDGYKDLTFFIERKMQHLGLVRYGTIGYRTPFKYPIGRRLGYDTKFYINGKSLFIGKDVIPLPFSAAIDVDGFLIPGINEPYSPWTLPLPQKAYTEENLITYLKSTIINAQARGAATLYFYDKSGSIDFSKFKLKNDISEDQEITIPVWIISQAAWEENFKNVNSIMNITSAPRYGTVYGEGFNVVGLIDNKAEKTVVLFSNFDQVDEEAVQGASFNASSVALLFQVADILKGNDYKKYNYAIAAFSGSSIGNAGAKAFLSVPGIKEKIAYAIAINGLGNIDLNNNIFINGIGSATVFKTSFLQLTDTLFVPKVGQELAVGQEYKVFLENHIPTLSLSSKFDTYDIKKDNLASMNFIGLAKSVGYITSLINSLNKEILDVKYNSPNLVINDADIRFKKPLPNPEKAIIQTQIINNKPTVEGSQSKQNANSKNNLKNTNNYYIKKVNAPNNDKTNDVKGIQSQGVSNATLSSTTNIVTDIIGLGVNELDTQEGGAVIQSVLTDSQASQLGLVVGDTVLQIGSFPIFNARNYLVTLRKYKEGERAYYKVKKANGSTVFIDVEF